MASGVFPRRQARLPTAESAARDSIPGSPPHGSDGGWAGTSPVTQWWNKRAWLAHAALGVWVPGCAVACRWQISVAMSGDSLGWVYSVMWPCFAVFGVIFWWHFLHDDPETVGARGLRRLRRAEPHEGSDPHTADPYVSIEEAERDDPELARYNAYLAELARQPSRGTWRRP